MTEPTGFWITEWLNLFYNRSGEPLSALEWTALYDDISYCRLLSTDLPDGKWVSTVWLGIDHNFGFGPPLIFETMVFAAETRDFSLGLLGQESPEILDMARYHTEEEAMAGHWRVVAAWGGVLPEPVLDLVIGTSQEG